RRSKRFLTARCSARPRSWTYPWTRVSPSRSTRLRPSRSPAPSSRPPWASPSKGRRTGPRTSTDISARPATPPMAEVFLDTSFAIAATVSADRHHDRATALAHMLQRGQDRLVTTHAILAEIADSFSRPPHRAAAAQLLTSLELDPS